ncbi:trypsin-like isoform X2 [Prorops nasuta]
MDAPFLAAIMLNNKFHCNSALVSPQFVLATADCILMIKDQLQNVKIRTGTNDLGKGGRTHAVEAYFLHNITTNTIQNNVLYTIGALKLKEPMELDVHHKPLRIGLLPQDIFESDPPQFITPLLKKWRGQVYGWGQNWGGDTNSLALRKVEEAIILRIPHCKGFLEDAGQTYYDHSICSYVRYGYFGNDGSILVYDKTLIGLASIFNIKVIDEKRSRSYASVFTYVHKMQDFIDQVVGDQKNIRHYGDA